MKSHKGLIEALDSASAGDKGIMFVQEQGLRQYLSCEGLRGKALSALQNLQGFGLSRGDELLLQLEDNEAFVIAFWACIMGGIVPVPVAAGNNDEHKLKIFRIWRTLERPFLIGDAGALSRLQDYSEKNGFRGLLNEIKGRALEKDSVFSGNGEGAIQKAGRRDPAFIQFSSGSTGDPKGVVLTHGNLLENIESFSSGAAYSSGDTFLSWFPLTHDMGLIGWHILPLVKAIDQLLIPTGLFVRRPSIWMSEASEHRATVLCSPNFGYKHFLKLFKADKAAKWDLSTIRIIVSGAEPISPELCEQFLERLAPYGLKRTAVCPGYGLAEATLCATLSQPGEQYNSYYLDRDHLNIRARVREVDRMSGKSVAFVDVGRPVPNMDIRISDGSGNVLDEDVVGHVEMRGASVTAGYYNNREAFEKVLSPGGWVDTGDLGFMRGGRLVITGRAKEIIIINGVNYYPQDIERIAEAVGGIDLGKVVACGAYNEKTAGEELIVFVYHKSSVEEFMPLARGVKDIVMEKAGLSVSRVIPVKKVPKTTSGKIQRVRLREDYIKGRFDPVLDEMARLESVRTGHVMSEEPGNRVLSFIRAEAEKILGIEEIDITRPLMEQGFNSIRLVEFHGRLSDWCGVELPVSIVFDYPSIVDIAVHMSETIDGARKTLPDGPAPLNEHELIAVIGLGCRFPGGADGPAKFWRMLQDGADAVAEVPSDRWDTGKYYRSEERRVGKECRSRWSPYH